MPEKRAHPSNDDSEGGAKRSRSNDGSPAPTRGEPTEAERRRAEVAARIAALKAKTAAHTQRTATTTTASTANISGAAAKEDALARIAAMKARLAGAGGASPSPTPQSPAPPPASTSPGPDRQAQFQAQLAAMRSKAEQTQQQRRGLAPPPPTRDDNGIKARGGLGIGLHPALMGEMPRAAKDGGDAEDAKKKAVKINPYLSGDARKEEEEAPDSTAIDSRLRKGPADRKSRSMIFNQKGKFIAQAEALRGQERLEKMKQDLQAQARKKAIETATERSYLVEAPPEVEWWDEGLLAGPSYTILDNPDGIKYDAITEYVQHPILLAAPQNALAPEQKPMHLTKKEQQKLRRQRRMADHKEEQAKIRLGLVPPPPPKVKKSNMMRVLGNEAVKDPTAMEMMVNAQIAERAAKHEAANEERKLTKEQRHEKLAAQKEKDAARGLQVAVFRVENLSNGQHRYKVDINAKQNGLTGLVVLHPKMNLVIVEGGAHSVKAYKKLMMQRIKWDENAAPVGSGQRVNVEDGEEKEWLQPLDEEGRLKDLAENRCTLVWEGDEKQRAFRRWGSKVCETDGEAKDALARMKMENMWTLAQSMRIE